MVQYFAIIAAAGTSSRFVSKRAKQYYLLDEQTVLEHSINSLLAFQPLINLVVALHPHDTIWSTIPLSQHPKITTTQGGVNRMQSVMNGLRELTPFAQEDDWVLVHDAARPYLTQTDLLKLIDATEHHPVGGILAAPIVDTIKYASDGLHIEKTIPRQCLYRALTPQCFRFGKLLKALNHAPKNTTDEAMALELAGYQPILVVGNPANKKITYLEDII